MIMLMEKINKEKWRDVPGYEGNYQVSNMGRIKGIERLVKHSCGGLRKIPEQILNATISGRYPSFCLYKDGNGSTLNAHRIVAEAFVENPENKPCVNHKNGIRDDNRAENLEWVTSAENTRHAIGNGLMKANQGEENIFSKLKSDDVINIRELLKTKTQTEVASIFNVHTSTISLISVGKTWKHI